MHHLEPVLLRLGILEDPKNLLGKNFNLRINGEILQGTIYTENEIDYEFLFKSKDGHVGSTPLPLVNQVSFRKGMLSFIFPKNVNLAFCIYGPSKDTPSSGYKSRKAFLDKAFSNPIYFYHCEI
jgi:hypothetical protein